MTLQGKSTLSYTACLSFMTFLIFNQFFIFTAQSILILTQLKTIVMRQLPLQGETNKGLQNDK